MKVLTAVILSSFSLAGIAATEELPSNMSREPNCIEGTFCLGKDDIYIPATVPEGFSREPNCVPNTACVSEYLYLLAEDFVEIQNLAIDEVRFEDAEVKEIRNIMNGVVHVIIGPSNPRQGYRYGADILIEKTLDGWVLLREQTWIE